MEEMKESFIYSKGGKVFRGFLCLFFFACFTMLATFVVYGVEKYGSQIVFQPVEKYENTQVYQNCLEGNISYLLSHIAVADDAKDEFQIIDVSSQELLTYDIAKLYDMQGDYIYDYIYDQINSRTLAPYRKNVQMLENCDITDYAKFRTFLQNKDVQNAYLYLDDVTFQSMFLERGLKNENHRFSKSFSENAYFLFDYRGKTESQKKLLREINKLNSSKSRVTELEELTTVTQTEKDDVAIEISETVEENAAEAEELNADIEEPSLEEEEAEINSEDIDVYEEDSEVEEVSKGTQYDLKNIMYAVYDPEQEVYYSPKDNYFSALQSYVYKVSDVQGLINVFDKECIRYNSILLGLLEVENKYAEWHYEVINPYISAVAGKQAIEWNFVWDAGQFYYLSNGSEQISSFEGKIIDKAGKTISDELPKKAGAIMEWLSEMGYTYYCVTVDENGSLRENTNGVHWENVDISSSYLKEYAKGEASTFIYAALLDYKGETGQVCDIVRDGAAYTIFCKYTGVVAVLAIIFLLLTIVAAIRLLCTTGRKWKGDQGVELGFFDKLPSELWFVLAVAIYVSIIGMDLAVLEDAVDFFEILERGRMTVIYLGALFIPALELFALFFMLITLSFARRIKAHNIWNHTLLYWMLEKKKIAKNNLDASVAQTHWWDKITAFFRQIFDKLKQLWNLVEDKFAKLKGVHRLLVLFGIYAFINLYCVCMIYSYADYHGDTVQNCFVLSLVMLVIALIGIVSFVRETNRLVDDLEEINQGELNHKVKVGKTFSVYKEVAEQINHIGDGLKNAVETSLKDERMKTELITNVSHDLKTPLTSIINYVDLLKKEDMPTENARHYLEVLDAKSQRLKQLTEDLVEAAKANSGNIEIECMPIAFDELMRQAIGEFEDKFAARNLEVVTKYPKNHAMIMADGRRLYRIVENVLQNAYKYALEGTRIYVDLIMDENQVMFSLKNVSAAQLNISPEELMERFTRGDASRTTEGSGLGLSIAKDLTHLMDGTFEIVLDGDLFKVQVTFPLIAD